MNILLLCHRLPFPANKGDKIRSLNILEHLLKRHTVYLGTFMDEKEDYQYADTVQKMVGGRCKIIKLPSWLAKARMVKALLTGDPLSTAAFYSSALQKWIDALLARGEIDRAVVFGSAMAPYLLKTGDFARRNVVFDMVDIDSDKWAQYAGASKGALRMIYKREARTLLRLEREATQIFPSTLLVSSFEAATMASLAPESRTKIHTAHNGVDTVRFSPDFLCKSPFASTEIPIVMTGRMDYRPNHEGAIWFAQEVLPLVRATLPGARFYAVGAKPPQQLCALRSRDVVVTGSVDDIRPYIRHAAIVVAPLHMARGVQNKVLEAMAMQKRVVATTPATRALDVRSGQELWVANAPAEFAAAIAAALGGADGEQIARNARRHVESDYAWERNLAIFDGLLDDMAEAGARPPSGRVAPALSVPRDMQTSVGVR